MDNPERHGYHYIMVYDIVGNGTNIDLNHTDLSGSWLGSDCDGQRLHWLKASATVEIEYIFGMVGTYT